MIFSQIELEILVTEARLLGAAQQIGHLQAPSRVQAESPLLGTMQSHQQKSGFHPQRAGMNFKH